MQRENVLAHPLGSGTFWYLNKMWCERVFDNFYVIVKTPRKCSNPRDSRRQSSVLYSYTVMFVCLSVCVCYSPWSNENNRDLKFDTQGLYQNIFPLANTFAKRENVRPGQSPTGTQMVSITALFGQAWPRHWISPIRTYVKLDYISSLLPQTACLGKICGPRYLGPKLAKSAIFSIFFSFSNINFEILTHSCRDIQIVDEKLWVSQILLFLYLSWGCRLYFGVIASSLFCRAMFVWTNIRHWRELTSLKGTLSIKTWNPPPNLSPP